MVASVRRRVEPPEASSSLRVTPPPQYAQPAPVPAAASDPIAQLALAELKDQGILIEDEVAAQKARVLGL